jgi:short-subunit dehydrogenase
MTVSPAGLTTLVTGATSGIGLHLAHQFAAHGHPLILVAPDQRELALLQATLETDHGASVTTRAADLEQVEAVDALARDFGDRVDILVNNAGQGFSGRFWEQPIENHLSTVRLNVEAVLRLTLALLPRIVERNRGGVLTTASVAGFQPGPTMATYHASKAFVLSWSEALAQELKDTGVTITALCPGPTDTDFFEKAGLENSVAFQQANLMAPQDVAKIGYDAFMRGERVVVAGALNKAMVASRHLMPESLQAAFNEKLYEDVAPEDIRRVRGDKEDAA